MKTLVLYNKTTGNVVFTQTNATEEYDFVVEDIEETKEIVSIDTENKKCVLENRLATAQELENKINELDVILNENEELTDKIIELTAQNLINE